MVGIFSGISSCFRPTSQKEDACVFCGIEKSTRTLYQDDTFIAFEDIKPAAKHHFLVIPRSHVESIQTLTKEDVPFLKDMHKVGVALMDKYNIPEDERRMGFHIPPANSVDHLHLHVHVLPYRSSLIAKKYPIVKGSGSNHKGFSWFVEVEQAIRILESGKRVGTLPC